MRKKTLLIVLLILIVAALLWIFSSRPAPTENPQVPGETETPISLSGDTDIQVADQGAGNLVVIAGARLPQLGFVAIHSLQGEAIIGPIIGSSALLPKGDSYHFTIAAALQPNTPYLAVIYLDNGDGSFNPDKDERTSASARFSTSEAPGLNAVITSHVSIKNLSFIPADLNVKKGAHVVFTNMDAVTHTVTSAGFDSGAITTNGTFTLDTDQLAPGKYEYHCNEHPNRTTEHGTITVEL